jgi:glutathione peroxidase
MKKMLFLSISCLAFTTSIYTFSIKNIDNVNIPLSNFSGKKILIVNTATNSPYVNQYAGLDSLYQLYHDSLVIIAFPSNSFGHELNNNNQIKNFVNNTYHIHYILAKKTDVKGNDMAPLYRWLALPSENGMMRGKVNGDFYKFLINSSGTLIGTFNGSVQPMSATIRNLIQN